MNTPLVSICIPAYNAEKYIAEALNSLLNQTYSAIEIIVVNDGSTDCTSQILAEYYLKGIKVINQENKGQCAAANRAYLEATGDYIKFFDADDVLSKDFIKTQVEVLSSEDNAIACSSWGRFYNDDLSTFKLVDEPVYQKILPVDWIIQSMWNRHSMMQCALWLIPKKILERSGLWNERLSLINDFEFFIRVLLNAKEIISTPSCILYYRSGVSGSLSKLNSRKGAESAFLSIKTGTDYLMRFENSYRTKKVSADCYQNFIYTFFPEHTDLLSLAEHKVQLLGGSDLMFPAGGWTKVLCKMAGWKTAKKIKQFFLGRT